MPGKLMLGWALLAFWLLTSAATILGVGFIASESLALGIAALAALYIIFVRPR
jgi:hypothetical protein